VPTVADTQAPSTPANFRATVVGSTSATLAWQVSTDDVGVIGYFVRAGSVLYTYTEGSLTTNVPYLKASTAYTFTLTAMDASGKQSAPTQVTFTTAPLGQSTRWCLLHRASWRPVFASEVDLSWSKPMDSISPDFVFKAVSS
jgi:hypothetical protein